VDNNSTDNTTEVALKIWDSFKKDVPLKILQEPQQGLSYARHTGAAEAQFEFLLYCDDDNWLDEHYVRYTYCIMNGNNKIGVLGGRSEGVYETEKPVWFDKFQKAYVIGQPLSQSGIANARKFIGGAGMVIRKSALQLLESFSFKQLLSDRKGNELSSGGDVELCLITMFLDYNLYFDERLKLIHFMPSKRLSWEYCVNMISKGHSIPQIYFDLYFYCYEKLMNNQEVKFKDGYRTISRKITKKIIQNFCYPKNFWNSFKCLIRTQPGSRKEIEIKSTIHKLKYLLSNRSELKKEFRLINDLIYKIRNNKLR